MSEEIDGNCRPCLMNRHEEFLGKISIQEPKAAVSDAQKNKSDLALWSDGSRLESGKVGAAVV